ncbi:MAG: VWA domain-containing protein [Alphaproteobacteria bacterium]|nr:VWA domain-containing protein [Alphaproteobacteria bacterium]
MAAPTWPPTPEEAARLTMDEYGVDAAQLGLAQEDAEVERALLAPFLFGPPPRLREDDEVGTPLAAVSRSLSAWLRMVGDTALPIAHAELPATDGQGIYLPVAAPAPAEPELDARLFRVMALVQLGLLTEGWLSDRQTLRAIYGDWVLRGCYHLLAARAVVRGWAERFPGVRADIDAVRAAPKASILRVNLTRVAPAELSPQLLPLYEGLVDGLGPGVEGPARAAARAVDAAAGPAAARLVALGQAWAVREHLRRHRLGAPPIPEWLGVLRPEWLLAEADRDPEAENAWRKGLNRPLAMLQAAAKRRGGLRARLAQRLTQAPDAPTPRAAPLPEAEEGRAYDEWDATRGAWRLRAVRVTEPEPPSGPLASYERLVAANQREIKQLRRRFEALRAEQRWVGGLPDGTALDLDRALVAMTDLAAGQQPRDDLYKRFVRRRQDLCVLTLVDLSGSTRGRILHLQQEALILFAEGLRALGVAHAFAGFSGDAPGRCQVTRLKDFDEPYGEPVFKRLGNLRAGGATRLGAYVRHATWMLRQRPEGRRVLLLLSDGKPEDRDLYRGPYGVADSAMAVREARRRGVLVHALSLDERDDAPRYLDPIFGPGRYAQLRDLDALPHRLPALFSELIG